MLGSLRKSLELKSVSKTLGAKPGSSAAKNKKKQADALQRLIAVVADDKVVLAVLAAHRKSKDDLEPLFRELIENGAAKWEKDHFVAASTLAYGRALDFTLTSLGDDKGIREIAWKLTEYFKGRAHGPGRRRLRQGGVSLSRAPVAPTDRQHIPAGRTPRGERRACSRASRGRPPHSGPRGPHRVAPDRSRGWPTPAS